MWGLPGGVLVTIRKRCPVPLHTHLVPGLMRVDLTQVAARAGLAADASDNGSGRWEGEPEQPSPMPLGALPLSGGASGAEQGQGRGVSAGQSPTCPWGQCACTCVHACACVCVYMCVCVRVHVCACAEEEAWRPALARCRGSARGFSGCPREETFSSDFIFIIRGRSVSLVRVRVCARVRARKCVGC